MRQRHHLILTAAALLAASSCGTTPTVDAGVDAGTRFTPTQTHALGLNDVTWLLPLESPDAGSPFPPAAALLPFDTFTRLTTAEPRVLVDLPKLRVLAVRFDECDRPDGQPCPTGADGVIRLVLQPVYAPPPIVLDITLHAFYPVPNADLPELVDTLRGLAAMQNLPRGSALQVSTAFTTDETLRAKLGALVSRYANAARLTRLTLFGQETDKAALQWVFRGEELQNGTLQPIVIPGVDAGLQEVLLFGGDSYIVSPVADAPLGFQPSLIDSQFRALTPEQQLVAVRGMLAVDNPLLNTSGTVQCVSCHVTTSVLPPRAADAGLDVTTLSERYAPTGFDLTPLGSPSRNRTLRALGYFGSAPLVSQRVVNESAHVVEALEAHFPPP